MRTLEVRRHTMRDMSGQHLTQAGVDLARRIGGRIGRFERVVTSTVPRAFETAIAMGFAVDEQIEQLGLIDSGVEDEITWDAGFAEWARVIKRGGAAARFAQQQAEVWRSIMRTLPENGRALIITHGGFVEAGTIGCLPSDATAAHGAYCSYCEGVRLTFENESIESVETLRVG